MDLIKGDDGNDRLYGHGGLNKLEGGPGGDYLHAGSDGNEGCGVVGSCGLWGDAGDDTLVGSPKADALHGGDGDDELFGNEGEDYLRGGAGSDLCVGGEGDDTCWGEAPFTATIAEDDDLCHKDVETKISCRGPGQPEFFEVTFHQVLTAPETRVVLNGTVLLEYTRAGGLYRLSSGQMEVDMQNGCSTTRGTYTAIPFNDTLIRVMSQDQYGRNLEVTLSGQVMTVVVSSLYSDPCDGVTLINVPDSLPGPTLIDLAKKEALVFDSDSLNFQDIVTSGVQEDAQVHLKMDFKATGDLFKEVED
jgi:Ca2+-binding RTX toxin-like protein